ncbi:MAG: N-acetylmannosamine-6-phosphate 2-epimerase [Candidatus Velthaea sp.]
MSVLERLRGGVIVSVQAEADSLLNTPQTIALLARVAEANGAAGGFGPYITVTEREIGEAAGAGADIIAFDATGRQRPTGLDVAALCAAVRTAGALPMADCATLADGRVAAAGGAAIVASTLCGYTDETRGTPLPALDLVRALSALGAFTICEGGVGTPGQVKDALATGADAVVVGTAITNIDVLVRRFAAQTSKTT